VPKQQTLSAHDAQVGDVVEVVGHSVGQGQRVGEVLEVSDGDHLRLQVRWQDGHVSVLYPGGDIAIRRARPRATQAKTRTTAKR
jgi:hypothetical protein